jgi:formamidopyrimidine-DNA glycosylase
MLRACGLQPILNYSNHGRSNSTPYIARLGPDVADQELEIAPVLEQVQNPKFGGRQLCHLLLDQSFLAGVGNYLRSEILFNAGLDPSSSTEISYFQ